MKAEWQQTQQNGPCVLALSKDIEVRAVAAVNAVIALFKGPLLCEDTME